MKHNDSIKQDHILKYLDKNLKNSPEKSFVMNTVKDSFGKRDFDYDYDEWVDLPDDSYYICDKCKKPVNRYWHKHIAIKHLHGEQLYMHWNSNSDVCLCESCFGEMIRGVSEYGT